MFASAEIGHVIPKDTFDARVPALRAELLAAQYAVLEAARFPVVIVIAGVEGAGKSETVNTLNEWMDPRHIRSRGFGPPTAEEGQRPRMWRYWQALPPKGRIGVLFGSWYTEPVLDRVMDRAGRGAFERALDEINRFEAMLVSEGVLLLKFWFHLSKSDQRKRLKGLEKDPRTAWRVTPREWEYFERYDDFREVSERALAATNTGSAPWVVVEGTDPNYRELTVGEVLLDALRKRLAHASDNPVGALTPPPLTRPIDGRSVLDRLDLSASIPRKRFQKQLEEEQGRLALLTRRPEFQERSLILVFEGADAAGKGGAIRRVTAALDARQYDIVPVAAPTEEERAQPYLWRFWRHVPRHGRVVIFDRSWYGRVLVERVEGFCQEDDWMRAYAEINDFEEQLAGAGAVVVKLWLQISAEEQLRRFQEREQTLHKRHKITAEDWRNREKWDAYRLAASDMIDRTSTRASPWHLVAAEDKLHARVEVVRAVADRLERSLS